MTSIKHLVRLALRVQNVWRRRTQRAAQTALDALERLEDRYGTVTTRWHTFQKAAAMNLTLRSGLLEQVGGSLHALREAASQARMAVEQPAPLAPSLTSLYVELEQLQVECGDLIIDWAEKYVAIETEPITLEEVDLGPFQVRLFWDRLEHAFESGCFDIVALEPNPAAGRPLVTHPHVCDGDLCAGDSKAALSRALEQGRLADAFQLVLSVLRHYNESSPHVPLADWGGAACYDCGHSLRAEDVHDCDGCGEDYCEECSNSCAVCGTMRCSTCLVTCSGCDDGCCARCVQTMPNSTRVCCPSCRRECPACGATVALDDIDEVSERCPTCRTSASIAMPTPDPIPSTLSTPTPETDHATTLEPAGSATG